jgi:hypothetical protein
MMRWLRNWWWWLEDRLTDLLDWQRPAPSIKPLPPAPPEQHKHVPFHFTGVAFQRATNEQINDQFWNEIFQRIASGQPFDLKV